MDVFDVIPPAGPAVPVVLSSPHSGVYFPPEVKEQIYPGFTEDPDDTDWYIDQLYDFAPELGVTMIIANMNRWVIDLNRDPDSQPLYSDGRIITGLVPSTTFNGHPLYDKVPDEAEINRRRELYYRPYHDRLEELLSEMADKFGQVLLFDAHSIRRLVPGIRKEPFPDLILGDADGASAGGQLIDIAARVLKTSSYEFSHNHPFKGGYITRHYGDPSRHRHALQLEMAKDNYMDDFEKKYHPERAGKMRESLKKLFVELINEIK